MVKEMFANAVSSWQQYWGDGFMQYLLLAALILLVILAVRDKDARALLIYTAAALFVFFCPLTEQLLMKAFEDTVYWRVLWILPTGIVIAYAFTAYLIKPKKTWIRIPGVIAVLVIAALCGKAQNFAGSYTLTHNRPQVPDEVAQIGQTILEDAPEGKAVAAADDHVASYLRVYDASIRMPYGRRAEGARNDDCRRLYELLQTPGSDAKEISDIAKAQKCTHLVIYQPGPDGMKTLKEEGWSEIGEADGYYIMSN